MLRHGILLSSLLFCASDVPIASNAAQLHLPADPQPEEHSQHRALIGQRRLGFTLRRNSSCIRSIALVVRRDTHWLAGN